MVMLLEVLPQKLHKWIWFEHFLGRTNLAFRNKVKVIGPRVSILLQVQFAILDHMTSQGWILKVNVTVEKGYSSFFVLVFKVRKY
jgi:hypothetical protein